MFSTSSPRFMLSSESSPALVNVSPSAMATFSMFLTRRMPSITAARNSSLVITSVLDGGGAGFQQHGRPGQAHAEAAEQDPARGRVHPVLEHQRQRGGYGVAGLRRLEGSLLRRQFELAREVLDDEAAALV